MDHRIAIDDEQMKAVLAKSIVDSLTPEARERLLANAVQKLMQPDQYSKKNPVQEAFDFAVQKIARKFADDMLEKDETFKAQIAGIFAEVAARVMSPANREKLIDDLADKVRRGITGDRY